MRLFSQSLNSSVVEKLTFQPLGGDVTDELQSFIDDNVGTDIRIGTSRSDVYVFDKPLKIPSYSNIEINATLKMADSVGTLDGIDFSIITEPLCIDAINSGVPYGVPLAEDLLPNTNIIKVANADQYFKVGQQIFVGDETFPIGGGSSSKWRRWGYTNWVTAVSSTEITCYFTFTFPYIDFSQSIQVNQNGRVSQYNSGLFIVDTTDVIITGKGLIDGNYDNQFGYHKVGLNPARTGESVQWGCGIAIGNTQNLTVIGEDLDKSLYIPDVGGVRLTGWVLHNWGSDWRGFETNGIGNNNLNIRNIIAEYSGEKNFLWTATHNSYFEDCVAKNGIWEGDFVFYSGNSDNTLKNIYYANNARLGFSLINSPRTTVDGLYAFNGFASFISNGILDDISIKNMTAKGSGGVISFYGTTSNNIVIDGFDASENDSSGSIAMTNCTGIILIKNINVNRGSNELLGISGTNNVIIENLTATNFNKLCYSWENSSITIKDSTFSNHSETDFYQYIGITYINCYDADNDVYLNN